SRSGRTPSRSSQIASGQPMKLTRSASLGQTGTARFSRLVLRARTTASLELGGCPARPASGGSVRRTRRTLATPPRGVKTGGALRVANEPTQRESPYAQRVSAVGETSGTALADREDASDQLGAVDVVALRFEPFAVQPDRAFVDEATGRAAAGGQAGGSHQRRQVNRRVRCQRKRRGVVDLA